LALTLPVVAAYWFAPGLVFYADMGVVEAMKQSFSACLRNWLPFLVYGILASLVILLGALGLVIGLFVALPVLMASYPSVISSARRPEQNPEKNKGRGGRPFFERER
jgi:uncharacterized membrane protein